MRSFLLGAKTEVQDMPTARDYVQDGLIAMWDGIENAGWGVHDGAATDWVDLVGGHDLTLYGVGTRASWGADNLTCLPANGWAAYRTGDVISPAYVEAMFISTMQNGDYSSVFSCGGSVNHVSIVAIRELQTVSGFSARSETPWHGHLLHISSDQSTHAMTLNGADISVKSGNSFSGASHLAVGGRSTGEGSSRRFDGRLYFVRLYSRALTAAEVAANYAVDQRRFGL